MSLPVWRRIRQSIADEGRAALVTIVSTRGSVPREAGARMVVRPDGSFTGTIGGGALEYRIIKDARSALASKLPRWSLRQHLLGPDIGQCCGGQVTVLIEVFGESDEREIVDFEMVELLFGLRTEAHLRDSAHLPRTLVASGIAYPALSVLRQGDKIIENFYMLRRSLLLFGAGHVGRALVMALAALPFDVRWVDTRADAFPDLLPANVKSIVTDTPETVLASVFPGSYVIVMTHSHPLDLSIISAALKSNNFGFVGLIGSETKRARFIKRMREAEISEDQIAKLTCPIGVPGIHGKDPAIIAVSVAAQLLQTLEINDKVAPEPPVVPGGRLLKLVGGG